MEPNPAKSGSSSLGSLEARLAFLPQTPLFAELDQQELQSVAADFRLRVYAKNSIIFNQGEPSRQIYLVRKGTVRIYRISPAGQETSINLFSGGDIIGEFAAIDGKPRSATGKAATRCFLLEMGREQFLGHIRRFPDLALGLARLLVSKVRWTAAYAEAVAQYDVAGRLLHILLLYNEMYGRWQPEKQQYVLNLSLNQTDLASLIGARREWVNRLLGEWRDQGLLAYEGRKIIIKDLVGMKRERDNRIQANTLSE